MRRSPLLRRSSVHSPFSARFKVLRACHEIAAAARRSWIETLEARRLLSGGFDFSGGFADADMASQLSMNQGAVFGTMDPMPANSVVQPGAPGSVWYSQKQDITHFVVHFSERTVGYDTDQGFTFTIQNSADGLSACGSDGAGALGYAGIQKSVAIKFDTFNNSGEGPNSTGMFIDGDVPTVPLPTSPQYSGEASIDLGPWPGNQSWDAGAAVGINLHSYDIMDVTLAYDATTKILQETITDTATGFTFHQPYSVDIPQDLGGASTAYVGFTGGQIGLGADRDILSWSYAGPDAPQAPPAPSNLTATLNGAGGVDLAWTNNAAFADNNGYVVYRKGGGDANFYPIASLLSGATTFTDATLPTVYVPTQQRWEYRVAAHNVAGLSAPADALASTPQGAPTNVVAICVANAAQISWSPVEQASSYNLYRSTVSGGQGNIPYQTGLSGNSFVDGDVSPGTTYFYTLTAVCSGAQTAPSAETATRLGGGLLGSYFLRSDNSTNVPADDQAIFHRTDMAGPSPSGLFPYAVPGFFDTGNMEPQGYYFAFDHVLGATGFAGPNTGITALDHGPDGGGTYDIRWEGTFMPLTSECYTFSSLISGGDITVSIWVNGQSTDAPIHLTAGVQYPIQIDYSINPFADVRFALAYQTPTIPLQDVPLSQLSNVVSPPAAPTNLQASNTSYNGTFNLSWEGSPNGCTYVVQQSTDGKSYSTMQADTPLDGPLAISFAASGLTQGVTSYIRVLAENAAGVTASDPILVDIPSTHGAPVNRWNFNDGAPSATAADTNVVGPANNGTLTGPVPPVWVGGTSTQPAALMFSGDGGVTLDTDLTPVLDQPATLTAWINTTQVGAFDPLFSPAILGSYDRFFGTGMIWGAINHQGQIGLTILGDFNQGAMSQQAIDDGHWHLVALSLDSSTGKEDVYVDGILSGTYQGPLGTIDQIFGFPVAENLQTIGAETIIQGNDPTPVDFRYFNGMLRDVRAYNRVLSAQEVADLYNPPTPSAPAIVSTNTIAVDLQSAIVNIEGDPAQPPAAFTATTSDQVSAFLNAVSGTFVSSSSEPVKVTLDAPGITVQASQVTVPTNMVLTINGVKFDPDVPAMTLNSGSLVLTNCTLITTGNAPTILVNDGNLTLRNDIVQESSGYAQAGIEIDGGSVDLGSASDPGGNTLDVNGAGVLLRSGSAGPLIPVDPNAGNTFQINGRTASADDYLQGLVWVDFNNDGLVDFGEAGIGNVPITLAGTDLLGNHIQQTLNTDANGIYNFPLLWPGTYSLTEGAVPPTYIDGKDAIGTAGGDKTSHSLFSNITIGADQNGLSYNFGQQPAPGSAVAKGQAAGIGFWANKNGQALINKFASIGNWLADTIPNTFGVNAANNLNGMMPAQVAGIFLNDFLLKDKLDAQVMATALNVYATDSSLGGSAAASYGFTIGTYGLGDSTWNVGADGAAFNVANSSTLTVIQILQDWDQQTNKTNKSIRQLALDAFGGINSKGGL